MLQQFSKKLTSAVSKHPKNWQRSSQILVVLAVVVIGSVGLLASHADSTTLTFGSTIQNQKHPSRSFSVAVKYSGTLIASLAYKSNLANASLFVYGPNGNVVTSASGKNPLNLQTSVSPGTYTFTVRGKVTRYDSSYFVLSVTPPSTPPVITPTPQAPTNLAATAVSATSIHLTWQVPSYSNASGYNIYRNNALVGTSPTNSYTDIGLSADTSYSYFVEAYDTAGTLSSPSNAATAITLGNKPTPVPVTGTGLLPDSYFDQADAASATVSGNSQTLVNGIVYQYQHNYCSNVSTCTVSVNDSGYSVPVYTVPADQPTVSISVQSGCNYFVANTGTQIPIPSNAKSATGTDHGMIIYQPATHKEWDFWEADKSSNGSWSACAGGLISDTQTSNGVFQNPYGENATGLSFLATLITESDIQSGSIDHALALDLVTTSSNPAYVFPATRSDGFSNASYAVPEGTWLRLDPSLNVNNYNLTPFGKMVFVALQKYGMYVVDKSGAVAIVTEDPSDWQTAGNGGTDPISAAYAGKQDYNSLLGIPWGSLQALNPPSPLP